jgi:hypothetical protein
LIPTFSSPATSWVQKVALLTSAFPDDHKTLIDVTVSRLPEPLFSQTIVNTFTSLKKLLEFIAHRDQGSASTATHKLINEKWSLQPGQRPSALYAEIFLLAKHAMPTTDASTLRSLAKAKLISALPPASQALATTILGRSSDDELMVRLDDLCGVVAPGHYGVCSVEAEPPKSSTLDQKLDDLVARIAKLESSSQHHSSESLSQICWYHTKFGTKAFKCTPPCNFLRSKNL